MKHARIPRTHLIKKALACLHVHLGAPPGFGKTTLLNQLYRHFMRGGRGPRKGRVLAAAEAAEKFLPEYLTTPDPDCRWIVAVDDIAPEQFEPLCELLFHLHGKNARVRLFTAGAPLPLRPFAFYKSAGTTLELGMNDLAFTAEETRLLCPGRADRIRELTAGWPFPAVHLASLPPSLHEAALADSRSILRTWMRQRVLAPCEEEAFELLTRLATLHLLDREAVARFGPPEEILPRLQEMHRRGWPLCREEKGLKMHPFMRRCLLSDLTGRQGATECCSETIRWYATRGDLLHAARAAFEADRTEELAKVLTRLESGMQRVFDADLRRELGEWIDRVLADADAPSPRFLTLAARCRNMAGLTDEALRLAQRSVEAARPLRDAEATVRSSVLIARVLRCRASIAESDRILRGLDREFPDAAWPLRYEILAELAYNRILESDYRAALSLMENLKEEAAGDPVALWAERFLALPLFFVGRCTEALASFRVGERLSASRRFVLDRHGVHLVAARCLQLQGCGEEARELLEKQLALKRLSDDPDDFWLCLLLASEIEFSEQEPAAERGKGDLTRALAFLEYARALLPKKLANPFFHAWYRGYAFISEALAHPETIRQNMDRALAEARSCSPWLHSMLLARGGMYRLLFLKDPNELPEIVDMLHEGRSICIDIGAETFRAFADAILAVIYDALCLKDTALTYMTAAFEYFEKENILGLFRTPDDTTTLVRMAWERGIAPGFVRRVIDRYAYRPPRWRAKLFGKFELVRLTGDGPPAPVPINRGKIREMLAFLIHNGGRVGRREIVSALWPETPYERSGRLFSVTLSQLRAILRAIGMEDAFTAGGGVYRLDTSEMVTDREGLEHLEGTLLMLPLIEREGQNLSEEFERLRLAPLREGYLGEFETPWARAAAREVDTWVARQTAGSGTPNFPQSA